MKPHRIISALLAVAVLHLLPPGSPVAASARAPYDGPIWHVDPAFGDDENGDGSSQMPFLTIQRAVDAAAADHTIELADGLYKGPGNVDVQLGAKALMLRSASLDAAACNVDCGGSDGFVFRAVDPGVTAGPSFEGLTVINAAIGISINVAAGYEVFSHVEISDCRISACVTGVRANSALLNIRDSVFAANTARGVQFEFAAADIADSVFRGNGIGCSAQNWGVQSPSKFLRTDFVHNDIGLLGDLDGGGVDFAACRFDSNTVGLDVLGVIDSGVVLEDCLLRDNVAEGLIFLDDYGIPLTLADSQVSRNGGDGIRWRGRDGDLALQDTEISGNGGWGFRGSPYNSRRDRERTGRPATSSYVRCRIVANQAGGVLDTSGQQTVQDCVITGNGGDGLRLQRNPFAWDPAFIATVTGTTIAGNAGVGLVSDQDTIGLERVLIAGNDGAAVDLPAAAAITVTCTNLHGNAGGDWVAPIAELLAQDGNLAVDPQFCDPDHGGYALLDLAPCLPGNHPGGADCGVIGALDAGCFAAPRFLSLKDVPNDQGRQLRLVWTASHFDRPAAPVPVVGYGVYRRQDTRFGPAGGEPAEAPPRGDGQRLIGWDYIATVPGRGDEGYQFVAPTLCDSTEFWDPGDPATHCWSVFMISAMTANTFVYYDSAPDSGYSVDNLSPAPPAGVTVAYDFLTGHQLSWLPNPEPDLRGYRIYRGQTPDFTPPAGSHIVETVATNWLDTQAPGLRHYLLTAVDLAGNESPVTPPQAMTAVTDAGAPGPGRPALAGAFPNPFNPATTIAFDLARPTAVTLRVYDLAGRLVCELVAGQTLAAGRHEVPWRGRDSLGRAVASGNYLFRFEADGVRQSHGLTLLK